MMTFGEKLRAIRKQKKITLKELSERTGAGLSTIGDWERNKSKPDIEKLASIIKALDVDANYFFMDDIDEVSAMQKDRVYDKLADLIQKDFQREESERDQLYRKFQRLNPEGQKLVNNLVDMLLKNKEISE